MITFVTHYITIKPQMKEKIRKARRVYTKLLMPFVANPESLIHSQYESIKKSHSEFQYIVLTDQDTVLELNPEILLIRQPMDSLYLDYESFKAKIQFLTHTRIETNFIFLEWDMLVQENLEHLFEEKIDLFFTFRHLYPMPFNDGFIAVSKGNIPKACDFLNFLLEHYRRFATHLFHSWYGLQLILKRLFLEQIFIMEEQNREFIITLKDFKIKFIDGLIYNFNPAIKKLNLYYPDKKVLHFSKLKKKHMVAYERVFLKKMDKNPIS